jgi:hypothetical protein
MSFPMAPVSGYETPTACTRRLCWEKHHINSRKRISMSNTTNSLSTLLNGVALVLVASTHLMAQVIAIPAPQFVSMTGPDVSYSTEEAVNIFGYSFTFRKNDWARVSSQIEITSSVTSDVYTSAMITCNGPAGFQSQPSVIGTNHTGKSTPMGVNYPSTGHLVLSPELAFYVPADGVYTCQLAVTNGDQKILTAIARHDNGSPATWFLVSASAGPIQLPGFRNDSSGARLQYQCNDLTGTPPCIYLGGASNSLQTYMFDNNASPAQLWEAPSNAAFVDVNATIEFTTCYNKTASCLPANWGSDGESVVSTHLEMIQLDTNLGTCKVTQSADITSTIGNDAHYDPIYHTLLDVPVYPGCGSRNFKLRILAKYVSGNPVHLNESPSFANTYADIITSYTGRALPMPNLIGLTEGVADISLKNSGYGVGIVSSVLNAAPAGTVLSQYPAAGIIELPGSGVNFTVSTGGVNMPNLLSLSQSSATSEITRLGLVPKVGFQMDCVNPGDVLVQSPQAGTTVTLGSTVTLTVDSGTYKTCKIK